MPVARAELVAQKRMDELCRLAAPDTYSIRSWKPQEACRTGDCFISQLRCSNGKTFELKTAIHPGTTIIQKAFYDWAPVSFGVMLLPLGILIGLAWVGSNRSRLLLIANLFLAEYLLAATAYWYASVTDNPWKEWVGFQNLLFGNAYIVTISVVIFVMMNAVAFWRGLEDFFFKNSAVTVFVPSNRAHAALMSAAFMPDVHEFIDPRETTTHYERETDRLRAHKAKLDAETEYAKAYLRRQRALNQLND
jgi:hypothetical protein